MSIHGLALYIPLNCVLEALDEATDKQIPLDVITHCIGPYIGNQTITLIPEMFFPEGTTCLQTKKFCGKCVFCDMKREQLRKYSERLG